MEGKHIVDKFADDKMEFLTLNIQHIAYFIELQGFEYQYYIEVAKHEL
jgi:hypothetical protein